MGSTAISTTQLTRRFGEILAVDKLDLDVPSGSVYGFLGPNGSGKTTTVRMLLGLIRPAQGHVTIFGQPLHSARSETLSRIGSMVESPSLYGHLTGRENLQINRRLREVAIADIDRVLSLVGLTNAANRKAGEYSLGMKQRLGLALALLGSPDLLILDEPTNGLDPSGIREIRELIRDLPKQSGVTVFLSSHLLNEVEQIASHVGIVHRGRIRFQGSLADLQQVQKPTVEITASPADRALSVLTNDGWHVTSSSGNRISVALQTFDQTPSLTRLIIEQDIDLFEVRRVENSLESLFLDMTEGATEDMA